MKRIKKNEKKGFSLCKKLPYIALLCQKPKLCEVDSSSSVACVMILLCENLVYLLLFVF